MVTIINNLKDWCFNVDTFMSKGLNEEFILLAAQNKTEVTYGDAKDCNLSYCASMNIPAYNRLKNGGSIVHFVGNVTMCYIYNMQKYRGKHFIYDLYNDFVAYLKSKGLNASVIGNDILIDNFKVASGVENYYFINENVVCYMGFQISINQDADIISAVCKKPMVKIPRALSYYDISSEDVYSWCLSWLKAENFLDNNNL